MIVVRAREPCAAHESRVPVTHVAGMPVEHVTAQLIDRDEHEQGWIRDSPDPSRGRAFGGRRGAHARHGRGESDQERGRENPDV